MRTQHAARGTQHLVGLFFCALGVVQSPLE